MVLCHLDRVTSALLIHVCTAYQAEAALVELVRRAKVEPATKLTIERYDDVAPDGPGA